MNWTKIQKLTDNKITFNFKGSVQNKVCSYFVSLRQGRGGGVHPKIFVSKPKMPQKMSKCL